MAQEIKILFRKGLDNSAGDQPIKIPIEDIVDLLVLNNLGRAYFGLF